MLPPAASAASPRSEPDHPASQPPHPRESARPKGVRAPSPSGLCQVGPRGCLRWGDGVPLAWVCGTAVVPYGGQHEGGAQSRLAWNVVPAWVVDAGMGGGGRDRGHDRDPGGAVSRVRAPPTCSPTRWGGRSAPCCWPGGAGRWPCWWRRLRPSRSTICVAMWASRRRCRSRLPCTRLGPPGTCAGPCWSPRWFVGGAVIYRPFVDQAPVLVVLGDLVGVAIAVAGDTCCSATRCAAVVRWPASIGCWRPSGQGRSGCYATCCPPPSPSG